MRLFRWIFLAVSLIILDQLTKFLVRFYYSEIIVKNSEIAFGLPMPYPEIIVGIVLLAFLVYFIKIKNLSTSSRQTKKELVLPFFLVISGGISNLVDRIRFGYVVDFIDLKILPTFNLADMFVFFGVLLFIYYLLKQK